VQYAEGSIVSRAWCRRRGLADPVRLRRRQELSEHSAPFDAYVQVLDGEAELVIGGNPVPAGAGSWC
jgi:hypothetical protein